MCRTGTGPAGFIGNLRFCPAVIPWGPRPSVVLRHTAARSPPPLISVELIVPEIDWSAKGALRVYVTLEKDLPITPYLNAPGVKRKGRRQPRLKSRG